MNIWDILLLPKRFYSGLTDKKISLYIGVLVVGIFDISIFLTEDFGRYFYGKTPLILFYNITLAVLLAVLIGFVDVLFFSVPMFDLFKLFRKEKKAEGSRTLIKVMKAYIASNLLIVPVSVLFYTILKNMNLTEASVQNNYAILLYIYIFDFLPSIWLSAAFARGVTVIYNFDPKLKNVVFITIFTWSYILANVIGFMIDRWVMLLFRY